MDQIKQDKVIKENNIIKQKKDFDDLSTVESQKDDLMPEEFTDGPYGAATNHKLGKEKYLESQRATSAFNYEYKDFHEGISRNYPGAHNTHDNPEENHEN